MDREEFDAWWQAFLAAMQGIMSGPLVDCIDHKPKSAGVSYEATWYADAALAVWREKRKQLHMLENGGKG